MKDKHFIITLALLVLPLSFGGGSTAGTKAAAEMAASNRASLKRHGHVMHGFTVAEMAALLAGRRIGSADVGKANELFVSSFDLNRSREDARCGSTTNVTSSTKIDNLNGNCLGDDGGSANARSSASGFPMYDSFKGSDTAQYSHTAGNSGPIGGGSSGGLGGGSVNPIVNGPVNPNVPISAPEPGTLMMLSAGLVILGSFARRRMRRETVSSN
jgi:PEP-CTERM motif